MQSWILLLPCLLFMCIPDVLAKRGGGGGGDGTSDNDSDDSSSSDNSSSGDHCRAPEHPRIWTSDLIPVAAKNYTDDPPMQKNASYDGSFFKGRVSVDFKITAEKYCLVNDEPTPMLGYAWIGPLPPHPVGHSTNPIIIGFKAWKSDKSLDEIDDSYAYVPGRYCPEHPDLFRVTTTYGWIEDNVGVFTQHAKDFMNLSVTEGTGDPGKVLFNATMPGKLDPADTDELLLLLPRMICTGRSQYRFSIVDRLTLTGSFTNATLDLTLSGSGNATAASGDNDYEITATFNMTFSGVFDSNNSTQKLSLQQRGGPFIAWVPNFGYHVAPIGWTSTLVCITTLVLFI